MTGLNRIFLLGYLGSTPKIAISSKGTPYTTLSIASPKRNPENGTGSTVDWHQVRVWGKQSELCAKFLQKGRVVLIEGYLSQYALESEGKKERRTAINAVRVDWLPRAPMQDSLPSEKVEQLTLETRDDASVQA